MSRKIDFTPVTEDDVMTIVEMRKKIWATTYRGIYPDDMIDDFDYEWHREKELQRINHPDYSVYLILNGGQNVGYLIIERKANVITLLSLYVLKEFQRQGIGTMAFDFVKQYCLENGATSFICHCVPENWNARRFYENMGGKVVSEDMGDEESWKNSVVYRFDFEN